MSASIKFDSTELANSTYTPRRVNHESSPNREIVTLPITRQDGSVKISSRYSEKIITIEGVITGTSAADLESKIDTMKELLSRQDKNLDIDWNGATRRYVATCQKHNFDRDHFNILYAPWTAEFLVPAGLGIDTASTSLYDTSSITATTTTINPLTFAGSAQPKPVITINLTTVGSCQVIKLINNDTGQFIKVDGPFANADVIIVDCDLLTVTKNGTAITFRGMLPNFYIGANSFSMVIIGDGDLQDQTQSTDNGSVNVLYDDGVALPWAAQSFIPGESGYIDYLSLVLIKNSTPTGNYDILIYSDNNNTPGTNLTAGNPGYRKAVSGITTKNLYDLTWVSGTRPFLIAGVKYWLVQNPATLTGSDLNKYIGWYYGEAISLYPSGKAMWRKGSTGTWRNGSTNPQLTPDYGLPGNFENTFVTYVGSGGAASHSVRLRVSYVKKWL